MELARLEGTRAAGEPVEIAYCVTWYCGYGRGTDFVLIMGQALPSLRSSLLSHRIPGA